MLSIWLTTITINIMKPKEEVIRRRIKYQIEKPSSLRVHQIKLQ